MKVINRNNGLLPTLLDNFFTENRLDVPNYENFRMPPVNIRENLSNFTIEIAVPGFRKENFSIEVDHDILKVSGDKRSEVAGHEQAEESKFTRQEFSYQSFAKTFNLPEIVNAEEVHAIYEAGILGITLPKKEEHKKLKRMVEIS